jgi:hypothetical protein
MIAAGAQQALLPAGVPTPVVFLIAAASAALWAAAHRLPPPRARALRAGLLMGRLGVGFVALLAAAQAAQRVVVLATNWPLWPLALGGAAAVEGILGLYALERRTVSRRVGAALAALRVAAVLLAVAMLTQPVAALHRRRDIPRCVAVLVDDSASMYVADTQMSPAEKVRLAEALGARGVRRQCRLDAAARRLRDAGERLKALHASLAALAEAPADLRRRQLRRRRDDLRDDLTEARDLARRQAEAVERAADGRLKLPKDLLAELRDVRAQLRLQVIDRLDAAAGLADDADALAERYGTLVGDVRRAAAGLAGLAPRVDAAGEELDALQYRALPAAARKRADALAARTRLKIARRLLLDRRGADDASAGDRAGEPDAPSLLERLEDGYAVRIYTFAGAVSEADRRRLGEPDGPTTGPTTLPPAQQQTDLAAALDKALADTPAERLAGVLLLTDGRHNAAAQVEPAARRLGVLGVPVCAIALGAREPPIDAAVLALDAPQTVYAKDTVRITAKLKLDGLAGRTAHVRLLEDDTLLDEREVRIPAQTFRTQVELSHDPETAGVRSYRVAVDGFNGEALRANNACPLAVSVTDDRIQVLLADGRPRWEMRYLKNLFAGRDRTVKLQYVVFDPDRVAGLKPPPRGPAAAGLPADEVQAGGLPADLGEWLKFDLVILGDVPPEHLTGEHLQALRAFVMDRGGTLIVIAGRRHMPGAYGGTALAELLPVRLGPDPAAAAADRRRGFRIALTPQGREDVIMRQAVQPERNLEIWAAMPRLYWRLPVAGAKEGADVLAYALTASAPDDVRPDKPAGPTDEQTLRRRRRFMRRHPLIAVHRAGMGKVVFLATDRTWRLRYRKGDVHHHKFWGQVLRWATADKLPAGTAHVKLGTDRARYTPKSTIRLRARIIGPDLDPVVSSEVTACVYQGRRLVLRKKLDYQPNSAGRYAAQLGELPSGEYRVELEAPPLEAILAAEGAEKVAIRFTVAATVPDEQTELLADRGLLRRVASLTGGQVAEPGAAGELLAAFGPGAIVRRQTRQLVLWSSWPYLVTILILLTAEWLLRKKVGLA